MHATSGADLKDADQASFSFGQSGRAWKLPYNECVGCDKIQQLKNSAIYHILFWSNWINMLLHKKKSARNLYIYILFKCEILVTLQDWFIRSWCNCNFSFSSCCCGGHHHYCLFIISFLFSSSIFSSSFRFYLASTSCSHFGILDSSLSEKLIHGWCKIQIGANGCYLVNNNVT